jgi:hypothetical protein
LDYREGLRPVPPVPGYDPIAQRQPYWGGVGYISIRGVNLTSTSRAELARLGALDSAAGNWVEANIVIAAAADARAIAAVLLDAAALVDPEDSELEVSAEVHHGPDLSDDDSIVGIDQLVEAILIRAHDSDIDYMFWTKFIDLSLVVLGFEGRDSTIRSMLEDMPYRVVPHQGAMEVPQEYAAAIQATPDFYGRVEELGNMIRDLQREFLRNTLLASDPSAIDRTTTVGRLRELGLPEQRYFSYEDY